MQDSEERIWHSHLLKWGVGIASHRITHPRGVPFNWKDVEGRASSVLSVDRTLDRENLLYLVGFGVREVML